MSQLTNNTPSVDDLTADDLMSMVEGVVLDPHRWVRTPNDQLGGREPIDLINGSKEKKEQLYNLLRAIEHGMFT